jgi:hypothetical protein
MDPTTIAVNTGRENFCVASVVIMFPSLKNGGLSQAGSLAKCHRRNSAATVRERERCLSGPAGGPQYQRDFPFCLRTEAAPTGVIAFHIPETGANLVVEVWE